MSIERELGGGGLNSLGSLWRETSGGDLTRLGKVWREESDGSLTLVWEKIEMRPDGQEVFGNWDLQGDSPAYQCLDDEEPDGNTTHIAVDQLGQGNTTAETIVSLENPGSTPSSSHEHILVVDARLQTTGDGDGSLDIELEENGVRVALFSDVPLNANYTTQTYVLDSTEIGNISDYDNLDIDVDGSVSVPSGGSGSADMRVTAVRLDIVG